MLNGEKLRHCIFPKQWYSVIWKKVLHAPLWISKVNVIQWPWSKVTRIECLSTFSNDFSFETSGLILIKFHIQYLGNRGSKICSNGSGHMAEMASIIPQENTFFSRTTGFIAFETWYVASSDWVLLMCTNADPRLTLTYFSSVSNSVPWTFEWRKGETLYLSKTVLSCDMKVGCTWNSVNAKGQGHPLNKLANQQTSKLSITCHVFSKDIPSEATWQIKKYKLIYFTSITQKAQPNL